MKQPLIRLASLIALSVLFFSLSFLNISSGIAETNPAEAYKRYSVVFTDSFDTVISFIAFSESEESFNATASQVHDIFLYLHKLYDRYNSYEDEGIINVYTLNQRAKDGPVEVNPLLFSMLQFAKSHYPETNGKTNIAMGAVLALWHNEREYATDHPDNARLPDMDELKSAALHMNIDDLILDPDAMTVEFTDPEMQLDVGAVAKGYATEIVAEMLLAENVTSFIISAGGNVRVGDSPMDGRPNWGIGLQAPDGDVFAKSEIAETLFLSNCSVVTSGDYQRYYTVDGTRYAHLIDPDTLMPGNAFRSVTIITKDSGYADLLSTAAFLMPYEDSRAFVESLDDVEGIWLFPDGSKTMTDGIAQHAQSQGAKNTK